MLASIIAGLVVAFVSGLTFVAYRHPAGYRKLFIPLMASAWGVWIVHMIYSFGEQSGFYRALDGVRSMNKDTLLQTPSHQPDAIWWFVVPVSCVASLTFISAWRSLLDLRTTER